MLRFFYSPAYKYTNRKIIDISYDNHYRDIDYANIDSPDTINGHIIYTLNAGETIPTYILDLENNRRYYVSGITQLRTGKFQISLLRDIISESPETWKNEEAYITAGLAIDYNKYKTWGLPYTNTKVRQERLNVNGKSSFFVFYVNTQHINGSVLTESDLEIEYSSVPGITGYDYTVSNLNEIPGYELVNRGNVNYWSNSRATVRLRQINNYNVVTAYSVYPWLYNNGELSVGSKYAGTTDYLEINSFAEDLIKNEDNSRNDFNTVISNFLDSYQSKTPSINQDQYNNINNYVNKIIFSQTANKVYTIRKTESTQVFNKNLSQSETASLLAAMRGIKWQGNRTKVYTQKGSWVTFESTLNTCTYTLEELGTATSFNFNFQASQRKLPKSAVRCVNIVSSGSVLDSDIAQTLMLAQTNPAMTSENAGTGRILDIQYLPFSVATTVNESFKINNQSIVAQFLDEDDYQYRVDLPDLTGINKETDSIKIVSPSRASQFLFKPYNNDGNMIYDVKITLKPNLSTIYVRPSTQGLLMADWDDKDCLVIQEDFSLTTVTSAWANYIYNNLNYQNSFNRQIEGREFERSWERRIEQANIPAEQWTARNISASKAQAYTGGLPIISNVAGAIGTAVQDSAYLEAARLDREYNEALYQESISLTTDLFNMQLENIKSQPNIPSRITTIDSKFLDGIYLEFYSTNPTELQAIKEFYRYNGNRIDTYGTFSTYWGWYVKGKIIISDNYTQPEINELNRRLELGIFTEVEYD